MPDRKKYNAGDVVGRKGNPDLLGIITELQIGDDINDLKYLVHFYDTKNPGDYETETCDNTELINKNDAVNRRKLARLNVGPGGSRKSRRRSRKNKHTRRARR